MKSLLRSLWAEEEGQTLVEYALIISLVALAVILVLSFLGKRVSNAYQTIGENIDATVR